MVKKVIEVLYSDLSDQKIEPGNGESVEFSYRGKAYEIDLTGAEAAEFDDVMARYVGTASRVTGSRGTSAGRRDPSQLREIRTWARGNGWPNLGDRGRIPAEAEQAFRAAH